MRVIKLFQIKCIFRKNLVVGPLTFKVKGAFVLLRKLLHLAKMKNLSIVHSFLTCNVTIHTNSSIHQLIKNQWSHPKTPRPR